MKKITGLLSALCLVVPLIAISGCDSGPPSCQEAMENLYDQECTFTVGGTPITMYEAIDGCEDEIGYAVECGCVGQHENLRECLAGLGYQQCDACGGEFDDYSTCFSYCSGG